MRTIEQQKPAGLYVPDQPVDMPVFCIVHKLEVKIGNQLHYDTQYGKVVWWECSACHGWHMLRLPDE